MTIPELIQNYGYVAVAVGTFLEGETVLLLVGAAANLGHLSLPVVIFIATLASFAGDQFFFYVGRSHGSKLVARMPSLQPRITRAFALLERHHILVILSIRFLYGLRIAGPIAIGMSKVSWVRFLVLNLIGAMVWAIVIASIGYWGRQAFAPLLAMFDADEAWALGVILLSAVIWMVLRRRHIARRDKRIDSII